MVLQLERSAMVEMEAFLCLLENVCFHTARLSMEGLSLNCSAIWMLMVIVIRQRRRILGQLVLLVLGKLFYY